jgi:DNA-binding response OmpR family regulator
VTRTSAAQPTDRIEIGDIVLSRAARLVLVEHRPVVLTMREFELLELLMTHADRVLTSAQLLDALWGPDFRGDPSTLTVHVLRLRVKIERRQGGLRHIRTVRGMGYIFDSDPV